jgi:hypothetical protein
MIEYICRHKFFIYENCKRWKRTPKRVISKRAAKFGGFHGPDVNFPIRIPRLANHEKILPEAL